MFNKRQKDFNKKSIITLSDPLNYISDSYRRIKVNIEAKDKDYKVFMVTSALDKEGKSLFLINLAKAYSEDKNKKVLVVDLNLRNPSLHEYYGVNNENGITNYIENNIEININNDDKFGFSLISSGSSTTYPTSLLEQEKLSDLIKELKKEYDIILLDTPSVLSCPDALVVAKYSDATLFVVSKVVSNKKDSRLALKELKSNNINVIGSVYNDVK